MFLCEVKVMARNKDKGSDSPLGVHTHSGPGELIEGRMTERVNEYCQCTAISMSIQGWADQSY